jgi:nitroreductase
MDTSSSKSEYASYTKPVTVLIKERFSCRDFLPARIEDTDLQAMREAFEAIHAGPCGAPVRFRLIAPTEENENALRGLGTYGFIKSPAAFIVGAVGAGEKSLEDYGYAMEQLVLKATDLGLGSCWLGGTFTRSSFSRALGLAAGERVPAVAALGVMANVEEARNGMLRRRIGGDRRLGWDEMFFEERMGGRLLRVDAGSYCAPLDMLRLAPSASNKQPWRVVREGGSWHFYLQRTRGYGSGLASKLMRVDDIQRVDMGIAMCHFELTARERFLFGEWLVKAPRREGPEESAEYVVSWRQRK